MAAMARDLLARDSVDATLERITASATELVEGCDAAGILVVHDAKVETLAATHSLVSDTDLLQQQLGEGPCFATRGSQGEPGFRIADLTSEGQRWPAFARQARQLGVGSMMGFRLFTEDEDLGALNFYSRRPGAFTDDSGRAGVLLASHAAVAFSAARRQDQMEQAIATRHLIGEAMGIVMGSHRLTEEEAFDVLRRYSQANNLKLREVARRVCERGSLS
ncbi:GAF and ANTAR domain-containing protein [Streptomyces sp. NPDC051105]|uniref:GAF and ANTAR domain-containing protein n=1 Tax=Streptomyces sp. NPDC051105 TaxID=3154843 RepID=UPI00342ADF28